MLIVRMLVALSLATAVLAGCSKNGGLITAPVKGKVTFKGKPLPNGTVMFVPGEGPAATGEIGSDGAYRLTTGSIDGAVLGNHKISITALADIGSALPEQRNEVGRLAARLGHGEQFAASGAPVPTRPERTTNSQPRRRRRR